MVKSTCFYSAMKNVAPSYVVWWNVAFIWLWYIFLLKITIFLHNFYSIFIASIYIYSETRWIYKRNIIIWHYFQKYFYTRFEKQFNITLSIKCVFLMQLSEENKLFIEGTILLDIHVITKAFFRSRNLQQLLSSKLISLLSRSFHRWQILTYSRKCRKQPWKTFFLLNQKHTTTWS